MKTFWVVVTVLLIAIGGFFITSLCLANENSRTLTEEWKSWFPAEEVVEDTAPEIEDNEDIVVEEQLVA